MSVDIGESLIQTWLRHVKRCDIVQTNWKAALHLGMNKDKAEALLLKIKNEFSFFGKKQNAAQIVKQLEIDALGCIVDKKRYLACDIAFHIDGLHYSKGEDTVPSKMLRTILCLHSFIEAKEAIVMFATPKFVNDTDKKNLEAFVDSLNDCLKNKWGLNNYSVKLYADHDFETNILNPVLHLVKEINDTSEVFVRACQLINTTRAEGEKHSTPSLSTYITTPSGCIDISELTSQDLIEQYVLPILSQTCKSKLKPYFDVSASKKMFGCGYAFFSYTKICTKVCSRNQSRYYTDAYYLKKTKQDVYVTNDCDRKKLIEWINSNLKEMV